MDGHKLKEVLRKVTHRKSPSQSSQLTAESNVIPSSTHGEQKPLPKLPRAKQQPNSTQTFPERNLEPSSSVDQNSQSPSHAVHQRRESLSRSFEQNRVAKPDPYSVASSSALLGRPTEPISSKPNDSSMSTSADAVATARTARDPDARANQDPIPAIAHNKTKPTGTGNAFFQANSMRDHSSRSRHSPRKSGSGSLTAETVNLPEKMHGDQDAWQEDRPEDASVSGLEDRLHSQGIDLNNTVDTDQTTHWAPAVTHEVIKPTVHHIREERIHREIHNYEVYHRIQPVYETVVLPARHFVPNPNGNGLIEVPESMLPDCTGNYQRWFIGDQQPASGINRKPVPQATEPRIVEEKTYMTPEGFPRTETTIMYPPTLEDMSGYDGPVRTIHFPNGHAPDEEIGYHKDVPEYARDIMPTTSGEIINYESGLPSPPESAASRMSSSPESPAHKKLAPPGKSMLEV